MTEAPDVPATDRDHQGIDSWAARGVASSAERDSAESDVVDHAMTERVPATGTWKSELAPGESYEPAAEFNEIGGTATGVGSPPEPGSATTQGDRAERSAFVGDGEYSGGQSAGDGYPEAGRPLQD